MQGVCSTHEDTQTHLALFTMLVAGSRVKLEDLFVEILIQLHYGRLVAAAVAIVGR